MKEFEFESVVMRQVAIDGIGNKSKERVMVMEYG